MSERKAINKWYPPDYDPSLVPKAKKKRSGNLTIKIRMMTPYSMRCLKCNEYIAQRRSFNAKKETLPEKYLNTRIIRFHITCPACNNPITFKTNPQTAGYTPENGAVRNFESSATSSAGSRLANSKKTAEETEDEILERLVREEEENEKYQMLKEKRKKNPFWNKNEKSTDKDVFESLQEKLKLQQRQQQLEDHLEEVQANREKIGTVGESELIRRAQKTIQENEERDNEAVKEAFKRKRGEVERKTISAVINVKKRKNTTDVNVNRKKDDGENSDSAEKVQKDDTDEVESGVSIEKDIRSGSVGNEELGDDSTQQQNLETRATNTKPQNDHKPQNLSAIVSGYSSDSESE